MVLKCLVISVQIGSTPEIVANPHLKAFSHADLSIAFSEILKFMEHFRSTTLMLTHALRLSCQASDFGSGEICNSNSGIASRNEFTKLDSATVHRITGAQ
jgi:hypothetical protein